MSKFDVHMYVIVRVKVSGVEAANATEAAKKADEEIDGSVMYKMFQNVHPNYETAYGEEIDSYLVDPLDEDGEVKFSETVTLDRDYLPMARH